MLWLAGIGRFVDSMLPAGLNFTIMLRDTYLDLTPFKELWLDLRNVCYSDHQYEIREDSDHSSFIIIDFELVSCAVLVDDPSGLYLNR